MLKKFALVAVMFTALGVQPAASHGHHYYGSGQWLGPALGGLALGAIIGGAIVQSQPPPPPVIYYHPPPPVVHHHHHHFHHQQRPHCVEYRRWDPYRGMWFTTPDCRY